MHPSGDEIRRAVAVEIADAQRDQMGWRARNIVHGELLMPVVLQPHEALRRRVVPSLVHADDHDVQVPVAVDVGRLRT